MLLVLQTQMKKTMLSLKALWCVLWVLVNSLWVSSCVYSLLSTATCWWFNRIQEYSRVFKSIVITEAFGLNRDNRQFKVAQHLLSLFYTLFPISLPLCHGDSISTMGWRWAVFPWSWQSSGMEISASTTPPTTKVSMHIGTSTCTLKRMHTQKYIHSIVWYLQ